MPFFCHYCGKERPDDELTKEHVLPQALGGNVGPTNPFLLDVCKRCNSACGRYVDGPFIRSWYTQMDRFGSARRYIDLDRDPVIPLLYMGENQDAQWEGKICDYWQGPAGDHVFHFHSRYPEAETVRPVVGRPLSAKAEDIDPGFILIFLVATHPKWVRCVIKSVMAQIDDAKIYVPNLTHQPQGKPRFGEIPENLKPLIEHLYQLLRDPLKLKIALQPDIGDRFLAKLALGFGSLLLDEGFRTSSDATKLRNCLWAKTAEEREALKINGTNFFSSLAEGRSGYNMRDAIGWMPGHVILLQAFGQEALALSVVFYGSQDATIRVTTNHAHWQGRLVGTDGLQTTLFLIAPGFQTFVGPVPLSRYIAARGELPKGNILPVVGPFLKAVEDHAPPPPFEDPEEDGAH